ncbi:MAG TPA: Ig-like domain-containing protein, partial [Parvularculaceae bacterium]|nr:Ig-like domain-containing protein [Parvularculaceae bacterium]
MRVVIIFILLVVLAFIAWQAAKQNHWFAPEGAGRQAETSAAAPAATAEKKPETKLPSFDIVRVTRDGFATIAGRAKPRAKVTVYANGQSLATADAIDDGSWALTTETPLDAGPVELSLSMTTTDGETIESDETIIIYVPERAGDRPLVVKTTPGGPSEVLQEPRDAQGGLGPLALDTIDYDDSGAVIFTGRAEPKRMVQIFVDKQFLDQGNADDKGRWSISPTQPIAPGVYTLTI